ncbi:uncharacterized protein [Asterias amurensis]|uniref:uncharacterized protein n=1 Tax=Asterias amurensis TaxID=7602 RepID=UPI003AB47FB4
MADGREGASFWDIGEPRKVLERIENGNRSCEDLMSMIQERADVEFRYAKNLRQWAQRWDEALMKGSDYGSVLTVWRAVLHEASAVAKIHENCRIRLTGDEGPFYNMYKWKNDHFHRGSFGGLRETREAVEQFAAAQKEYAKLLMKVQRAKKAYFTASVDAYRSRRFADDEASNEAVSPEARWRLRERADGLVFERERLKQVYLRRVLLCNAAAKERYVENMTSAFGRWQGFERSRVEHLKSQLLLFVRNISIHSTTGLGAVYQHITEQIRGAEPVADVEEWGRKHGTGCQAAWPKYEEIDPRTYREPAEEFLHHQHRGMVQPGHTTDDFTDEFTTTDDFDSELDSTKHHAQHHAPAHKPHRLHQYQAQQYRHHHHRPPGLRYSQNEDLSERWLKDHHRQDGWQGHDVGGVERGWYDEDNKRHPQHHNEDDLQGHNARAVHDVYDDHIDDLHKGQRSHHMTGPRSPHTHDEKPHHYEERIDSSYPGHVLSHDPGHDPSYNQGRELSNDLSRGQTNSFSETLAVMPPSQEFRNHGNHTSSAHLKNTLHDVGCYGSYDSRDVSSEENIATGKSSATNEEKNNKQQAEDKHTDDKPGQPIPQTANQPTDKQHENNLAHHEAPGGKTQHTPAPQAQQHQAPTGKTPTRAPVVDTPTTVTAKVRTYKDRLDAPEGKRAARLEHARQTLKPKEGERLVRALYDFKPATRDEMALKQGEIVVQIGHHLSNGWAYGRNKANVRGHFPASYVQ